MKSLVSILIPAYNAQKWLADALRSAIEQTWDNKEIIVIDDGSTDKTLAIAQSFESQGVRVFSQSNRGAAATRNKAYSLCAGDYIQWLDADDLLSPNKIEEQMRELESSKNPLLALSCAWGCFLYRTSRTRFSPSALWCDLTPAEWLMRKMERNLHMQTATWLTSRRLLEAAGPWNTQLLGDDDGEFFCRVLLHSQKVKFVPNSKVYYRATGPGSLSYLGSSDAKLDAQWHSMKLHISYLRSLDDSPRARAACVKYIENWLPAFHPQRTDVIRQMDQMAVELGGKLDTAPRLSGKYAWVEKLAGRRAARHTQDGLRSARWAIQRFLDEMLMYLERLGRELFRRA